MARPKGSLNRHTSDIRESIARAFHAVGGQKYLERLAKTRPDLFIGIVARVVPKELHATFTARYEALVVRVEDRPAPPALAAPGTHQEATFTVIESKPGQLPALPDPVCTASLTADDL